MPSTIHAQGDRLKLKRSFFAGWDVIILNGKRVYKGQLSYKHPWKYKNGKRQYWIQKKKLDEELHHYVFQIQILENGKRIHKGTYTSSGKQTTAKTENRKLGMIYFFGGGPTLIGFAIAYVKALLEGGGKELFMTYAMMICIPCAAIGISLGWFLSLFISRKRNLRKKTARQRRTNLRSH